MSERQAIFETDSIEFRSESEGERRIGGYALEWNSLSVPLGPYRERFTKGAFANSIMRDKIKALWNHNKDAVLGNTQARTLNVWEDDRGLAFEIILPNTTWGNDAAESIRRGDTDGVSFGFIPKQGGESIDNENGTTVRTISNARLIEVSPTAFAAYKSSQVATRSALREAGIDIDTLDLILTRSQRGMDLQQSDREVIRSTIEALSQLISEGASEKREKPNLEKFKLELKKRL